MLVGVMKRTERRSLFFKVLILVGALYLQVGCHSKDPNPELKDPLFIELQGKMKEAEQELQAAQAAHTEALANLQKVTPQTGQIKYAMKRVNDSKDRIVKTQQQIKYLEIKIESQKWRAKESYLAAFYNHTPWPSQDEVEEFRTMYKARQTERNWSAKSRREAMHLPVGRQPAVAPAKPAEGGGGGGH